MSDSTQAIAHSLSGRVRFFKALENEQRRFAFVQHEVQLARFCKFQIAFINLISKLLSSIVSAQVRPSMYRNSSESSDAGASDNDEGEDPYSLAETSPMLAP